MHRGVGTKKYLTYLYAAILTLFMRVTLLVPGFPCLHSFGCIGMQLALQQHMHLQGGFT